MTPTPVLAAGEPVYISTTRGSNTFIATGNVANTINANSIILAGDTVVRVLTTDGITMTGNVKFTTDAQYLPIRYNSPSTVMVSRYTAEVTPNTASINDSYVVTDLFEDFI